MRDNRLSRGQRLVVILLMATLVVVLAALGSIVRRRGEPASPVSTSAAPVSRATGTAEPRVTYDADAPSTATPTLTQPDGAADVLAARQIEELSRDVGQVRELPKRQEIPLNFLKLEELAAYLRQIRSDSDRRAYVQRQQALLAALGLSARPGEAFPATVQTRANHVLAFYDPADAQIFIGPTGSDAGPPDVSLVHQYAHAFVDQHFGLREFVSGVFDADAVRARDALMEGDAVAALALHIADSVDEIDLDALAMHLSDVEVTDYEDYITSRAMEDVFLFPYREGAKFVAALLDSGWWPAVNAAYIDPPVSTEQVLHPEKYIENPRDEPRTVLLPDLREDLGGDWHLVTQNVLGELILRTHLDQYLPNSVEAVAGAEGWGGDLAALWQGPENNEILVMRILWDSPDEASEFSRSYATVIDRRLRETRRVIRSILPRGAGWWRGQEGNAFLQQEGEAVLIIWTSDTETMEQVLEVFVFGEG